jgi:serine/threonine protein kinase
MNVDNPSQAAKSIQREYAMLSHLSHPNIIKAYHQPRTYRNVEIMEMELGQETVQQFAERRRTKENNPLSEEEVAKLMQGVFKALTYLHDHQNVIHRDMKAENILIGNYEDLSQVKLIDFGLAVEYTKSNIMDFAKCGTILYSPPE